MTQKHKKAYETLISITKNQIDILKDSESKMANSLIEMRQEILKYFQSCLKGKCVSIEENLILQNLRKVSQTLRQKHQDGLLQQC